MAFGGALTIVGNAYYSVPYTWTQGEAVQILPPFPGGLSAEAVAITNDGAVIVRPTTGSTYANRPHYRWTPSDGYQHFATIPTRSTNFFHPGPSAWSSNGRLTVMQSGSNSWSVWSAERGLEPATTYMQTQGVNLAASGLTSIEFQGLKEDGHVFYGVARRNGRSVGWFVTGLPLPCVADFNGDGFVDFFDYDEYVVAFELGNMSADTNGDGFLDFFDYDAFVEIFETGC